MSFKLDKPTMFSVDGYKRHSKDVNNKHNIIASGDITMEDVDFPVHGIDNLGNEKIMEPGKDYSFPGDIVLETPLKKSNMGYGKKYDSSNKKYEDASFRMSGFPMHSGTKEYSTHLKQQEKKTTTTVPFNIEEYPSTMSVIDQVTRQQDKKNRSKHDKTVEWKRPTSIYEQKK